MIDYEFGYWGIGLLLNCKGTVFKRSIALAMPAGVGAIVLGYSLEFVFQECSSDFCMRVNWFGRVDRFKGLTNLWASFCFVLGFLLVFRTQIAYGRYWDGITLLQNVRAVWFNAASNLISFCSSKEDKQEDVQRFQQMLVRLMSMLFATCLQEVAVMADDEFATLGEEGLGKESLECLAQSPDRLEVVMQWIQRLIVEQSEEHVLDVPAPILSRVFQELSNGIVTANDAAKITEYPFPFPFAQMLTLMLLTFTVSTPIICVLVIDSPLCAGFIAYSVICALWAVNYISAEIEMPFGDDPNDLPIQNLQISFNRKLIALLHPLVQNPPIFTFDKGAHSCSLKGLRTTIHSNWDGTGSISASSSRTDRREGHWMQKNLDTWLDTCSAMPDATSEAFPNGRRSMHGHVPSVPSAWEVRKRAILHGTAEGGDLILCDEDGDGSPLSRRTQARRWTHEFVLESRAEGTEDGAMPWTRTDGHSDVDNDTRIEPLANRKHPQLEDEGTSSLRSCV